MDVTRESSACAVIITQPIETICRMMCKVSLISITELLDRALSKSLFIVDDKNGKTSMLFNLRDRPVVVSFLL
jgi:hypothetical protein